MAAGATSSGELTQDINVLPLIDVLLVLLIMFLLMLRGLIFIPAQIPPPAAVGAARQPGEVKLLFIKPADNRSYQEVVSAMDLARGAGVQVLGPVPRASVPGQP